VTCRELVDFLADYLSGELPADVRVAFEHHLSLCADCRAYLANYQEAIALGRDALQADAAVPDDVPQAFIDAILASRRKG
jgi:anti-sigma factor RsiW